jgi:hypothetical protein
MCSLKIIDTATYFNSAACVITITILALLVYISSYKAKAAGNLYKYISTIHGRDFAKNGVKLVEQGYQKASSGVFDIVSLNG